MRDHVGADNIFIFGLTAGEVALRRAAGIDAGPSIAASPALSQVLDAVEAGTFSPDDRKRYRDLVAGLRHYDHFMVCADFDAYRATQRELGRMWKDRPTPLQLVQIKPGAALVFEVELLDIEPPTAGGPAGAPASHP
jgi:starch phosphorylase